MTIIKLISLYPKMPIAGVFRSKGYIKKICFWIFYSELLLDIS